MSFRTFVCGYFTFLQSWILLRVADVWARLCKLPHWHSKSWIHLSCFDYHFHFESLSKRRMICWFCLLSFLILIEIILIVQIKTLALLVHHSVYRELEKLILLRNHLKVFDSLWVIQSYQDNFHPLPSVHLPILLQLQSQPPIQPFHDLPRQ